MVDFTLTFPPGFLWGAATASHQVEGNNDNNNWAAWERTPGHIYQNQHAGLACDWWGGLYAEDFDHAAAMHHNAHRLSLEWGRIEPEPGKFDEYALAYYANMIGALRERGMEPMVTLHHFTHPQWIEEAGGWANPDTVRRFDDYVHVVVEALCDRVLLWCTINEPMIFATQGYLLGRFPPGKRHLRMTYRVAENMLRGHAAAYHTIKAIQPDAQVGFAKHQLDLVPRRPALLHAPARNLVRQIFNRAFVEALVTGVLRFPTYKADVLYARDTLDWIGLNYYYRFEVGFNPLRPGQLFVEQRMPRGGIPGPDETVGEIWPEGLQEQIKWLCERTGKPLYVTENGTPDPDDSLRPLHIVRSIRSLWKATNYNYPIRGYFFWTLSDNFEWAEGYDPRFRFGLVACDHETQQRTLRHSGKLYGEICAANALTSQMVRSYVPEHFDALFPSVPVYNEVRLPRRA